MLTLTLFCVDHTALYLCGDEALEKSACAACTRSAQAGKYSGGCNPRAPPPQM
ncbi:hypothetical protein PR002_g23013 [Phytophthora rubi]|uniref:Uncharacterized protein n=1 Tax=Phytophthora rubi TaxID=129364 RepID=A0A6A3IMP9_9STRA|nr:hypothetical protein PR002_g23013 [Phytophthora rubi]